MKSSFSPDRACGFLEPLEARIAPAVIVTGVPNSLPGANDIDYNEAPFEQINGSQFAALFPGAPDNAYFLKLSAGDTLKVYNTTNGPEDYLIVRSGEVIAFFIDDISNPTRTNEVDAGELVSLSVSKDAVLDLKAALAGDIVTNLDTRGTKDRSDDTLNMSDTVSELRDIDGLTGGGDIGGNILATGNIDNVNVSGTVGGIFAGSAVSGLVFDLLPGVAGGEGSITFAPAAKQSGSSITDVVVDGVGFGVQGTIQAGNGGTGANGGVITNVQLQEETNGIRIQAGDGGIALGKPKAGSGGNISKIYIPGSIDPTAGDLIELIAGNGGSADAEEGNGGKGGAVSEVFVGYQLIGNQTFPTEAVLNDVLSITAGDGGDGKKGGAGGAISKINVLLATDDLAGDEVTLLAGDGGAATADPKSGKAGAGGSITAIDIQNVFAEIEGTVSESSVLLRAGIGGDGHAKAVAGAGGQVSDIRLLTPEFRLFGGDGGEGKKGGVGGLVDKVTVNQTFSVIAHQGEVTSGNGGNGLNGNAGNGGALRTVRIEDGDFSVFNLTSGTGGDTVKGKGGHGGEISAIDFFDSDQAGDSVTGTFFVRSGDGGTGSKSGGNGGKISSTTFTTEDMAADVRAGNGGSVVAPNNGKGGAGGTIDKLQVLVLGNLPPTDDTPPVPVFPSATVVSGNGGNGAGKAGAGGAGGDLNTVSVRAAGSTTFLAGNGGNGDQKAAGRGGSIQSSGGFGDNGDGLMLAGNAGTAGNGAAAGGSIAGSSNDKLSGLFALHNLTVRAGDGFGGGAGGAVRFFGYGTTATSEAVAPDGDISIRGGDGSGSAKKAGAGGSVDNVTGSVSIGENSLTEIVGGLGGDSTGKKSSAGGSVTNLSIQLGGAVDDEVGVFVPSELRVLAGDAGDANNSKKGAKGGDVRNVTIFGLAEDTIIRSIASGDGGSGSKTGGAGGAIDNVRVLDHDIGVRLGQTFGYDAMGGIFAGLGGGSGAANGSVSNVTASAIAAIVAGRGATLDMAEKVSNITLATSQSTGLPVTNLLKVEEGDLNTAAASDGNDRWLPFVLARYVSNNLVGAVVDPTRDDANQFAFTDNNSNGTFDLADTPIDGLIMAKELDQATLNFTPEARFVGSVFFDYDNRNA